MCVCVGVCVCVCVWVCVCVCVCVSLSVYGGEVGVGGGGGIMTFHTNQIQKIDGCSLDSLNHLCIFFLFLFIQNTIPVMVYPNPL